MPILSIRLEHVYNSGTEEFYLKDMTHEQILEAITKKETQRNAFKRLRDTALNKDNQNWCDEQVYAIDLDIQRFVEELKSRTEEGKKEDA